jgi:NADH-quinone oxidoreductase subunit M
VSDKVANLKDATPRETLFLAIIAFAVLAMGLWPFPFLDVMHASVEQLLAHVNSASLR